MSLQEGFGGSSSFSTSDLQGTDLKLPSEHLTNYLSCTVLEEKLHAYRKLNRRLASWKDLLL